MVRRLVQIVLLLVVMAAVWAAAEGCGGGETPDTEPPTPLVAVDVVPGDGIDSTATVPVGEPFEVAVIVQEVPAPGLAGFQFDLVYDATLLEAPPGQDGATNPRLAEFPQPMTCLIAEPRAKEVGASPVPPEEGRARLVCVGTPPPEPAPQGDGTLATVSLRCLAEGTTSLTLDMLELYDTRASPIPTALIQGEVTCQAAP